MNVRMGSFLAFAMLILPQLLGARPGQVWVEGEDYLAQKGSTALYYEMPGASGGKIVNNTKPKPMGP